MLELAFIRENTDLVKKKVAERGYGVDLEELMKLDAQRRQLIAESDQWKHERKITSEKIGSMLKEKRDVAQLTEMVKKLSASIKEHDTRIRELEERLQQMMLEIPNLQHDSVPVGEKEGDNVEVRMFGEKRKFSFQPKSHVELGEALGILDFNRASKIAGARFALYTGLGARLERALINFMLDLHIKEHGYTEVIPPFMTNARSLVGTGNLPKFAEDLFKVENWDLYLIPTAEVPVTNIFQDEVLDAEELPISFVAYTPCFRSEAGSYGKDTRGLIRQHQFNKIELVRFTAPEDSYQQLEKLTRDAEQVLKHLGLHYRVVNLCTADLGFSAAKTYDLEVWIPSQDAYREISSCSNFTDFQARRANIRCRKKEGGKLRYVHTLNGSGLAVGRTVVALMEQLQQEDGSIPIPESLQPYMDGVERIPPQ
ncbi:serine--tRNA ligase [bacterium (candidate division B38) B3_B38]|nr:MAG: serine--tRNA ligase [bacterium (candidate division B38) B3_B38]